MRALLQRVRFSPDGRRLASASSDHKVKVWDASTGEKLLTLEGHPNFVLDVSFSSDGRRLASASQDHTVKVWDVQTGQELWGLTGHSDKLAAVAFSPDGERLASTAGDATIKAAGRSDGADPADFQGSRRKGLQRELQPRRAAAGLGRP